MNVKTWTVVIGLAGFMQAVGASSQVIGPVVKDKCAHEGEAEIHFTSKQTPDRLLVRVDGDDCIEPILSMKVMTSAGEEAYSVAMRAIDATYDCGAIESCVEWAFEGALENFGPWVSEEMPSLAVAREDEYYLIYDEAAYAWAYTAKAPLYCYPSGKSGVECVVYMDGEAVVAFYAGT